MGSSNKKNAFVQIFSKPIQHINLNYSSIISTIYLYLTSFMFTNTFINKELYRMRTVLIYLLVQLVYECLALVTNFALLQTTHTFICTYMLLNVWGTKIAECQFGSYGKDCTGRCSVNCYYTSRCNRFTGHCTDGCKAGWTGNTCDKRIF